MRRDPAARQAGVRLEAFDALGSTNEEALARARRGERGPLWITARRQTAGRGRRGRAWVTAPGNLAASLLLTDPCKPERAAELSFVAALALRDAVADSSGLGPRLSLKWPNDLLVDGAKAGGILVEGEGARTPLAVVAGFGVNCVSHPADTRHPATDLAAAGASVTADGLFRALSRTMPARLRQWSRGAGFPSLRAEWLEHAAGIGGRIHISFAERELTGRFETIDERGRLVLRLPDGAVELVVAGDGLVLEPV